MAEGFDLCDVHIYFMVYCLSILIFYRCVVIRYITVAVILLRFM